LDLLVDETYLLTFEHPDCVTKQLYVDATVTLDKRTGDFDFPLKVVLEHHEVPFTYAGPVGFIFYEHRLTDFSYTTDHTVQIDTRFKERMAQLQLTGVDLRSVGLGYTATTNGPGTVTPEAEVALPDMGTLAPMVAHVGPMVHRLSKQDSAIPRPVLTQLPLLAVAPLLPNIPIASPRAAAPPEPAKQRRTAKAVARVVVAPTARPTLIRHDVESLTPTCTWELIVEARRITTIYRFADKADRRTEYRRVLNSTGDVYYFQDGRSISEYSYDQGTMLAREAALEKDREHISLQQ